MTESHMIALLSLFATIIIGVVKFSFTRILHKIDLLSAQYPSCQKEFANREANTRVHKELFARTDELSQRVTVLETQHKQLADRASASG